MPEVPWSATWPPAAPMPAAPRVRPNLRPSSLKIAVIVDNGRIQRFALNVLNAIEGTDQVTIFSCWSTRRTKRLVRHAAYYALNLVSVRNPLTAYVPVERGSKRISARTDFDAEADDAWERLPPDIVEKLRAFDIILKFGMGLLRVPAAERAAGANPILSPRRSGCLPGTTGRLLGNGRRSAGHGSDRPSHRQ